jgi:hypothetical protein
MSDETMGPAYEATPMHFECIACHARSSNNTPEECILATVSSMMADNISIETVYRDLCFVHRRRVDDVIGKMRCGESA